MASKPSRDVIFGKEYIPGRELLLYNWEVGDEIVYNSDPEDFGNEHLHLSYGQIQNIFPRRNAPNGRNAHLIHIQLPYGKILIPLDAITLQFKPKQKRAVRAPKADDTRCGPMHQNHDRIGSDPDDDAKESSDLTAADFSKICRFFVYGPLRDDNDSGSVYTKQWLLNCKAGSGRLYGYRLYKERYEDYPFAVRTGRDSDYINGRIIEWPHCRNGALLEVLTEKLETADRIEGYIDGFNLYGRGIVDVLYDEGVELGIGANLSGIQSLGIWRGNGLLFD